MQILIAVENGYVSLLETAPGRNIVTIVDHDAKAVHYLEHSPVHPDGFNSLVLSELDRAFSGKYEIREFTHPDNQPERED